MPLKESSYYRATQSTSWLDRFILFGMCVEVCNFWQHVLMSSALAGSVMASTWCPRSYWHSWQEGQGGHRQSVHLTNNLRAWALEIRCVHVALGTLGTTVTFLFSLTLEIFGKCYPCNILNVNHGLRWSYSSL